MSLLSQEWNIQSRALQCAATGKPFEKGERIYSALYWREGQYARVDLCADAWKARNDNIEPLSAWQTEFVPPPPAAPEALKKDDAEGLLRRLMTENADSSRNARYILALMLERKKVVRQIERRRDEGGSVLVYEHIPSGEVWLIEDPNLKLGELKTVQEEVAHLLAGDLPPTGATAVTTESVPAPETESVSASETEPASESSEEPSFHPEKAG
jgi:hypothetical protein